jgi:hypothetical protein
MQAALQIINAAQTTPRATFAFIMSRGSPDALKLVVFLYDIISKLKTVLNLQRDLKHHRRFFRSYLISVAINVDARARLLN